MKVLMLNYEYPPIGGGAANANYYLLQEFYNKVGIEVDLITSSPDKEKIERPAKNITIYKLGVGKKSLHYQTFSETLTWSVKAYFLMNKLQKQKKYDLCHAWFGWPCGFFGYLNKNKLPYIVALRGSDVPGFNPRFKLLDKFFFPALSKLVWGNAKSVIANSDGLKCLAEKTWDKEIKIIYNGVNTEEFYPVKKNNKNIVLLTISRLIKRKNLSSLIRAVTLVAKKNKKIRLILVGEGPEESDLKKLASGLKAPVTFMGRISHGKLSEIYSMCDIYVLPSLNEGMSNTILEAMASGLPIITTDTGGTKELVDDNGIILKNGSAEEIRDEILNICSDKKKMMEYGRKSRETAKKLSWKNVASEYLDVYKKTA
jgi:glycosyltransferase involved in cell wall biosynthesis